MFWIYIRTCVTEKLKYHHFPLILQKKKNQTCLFLKYVHISFTLYVSHFQ